MSEQNNQKKSRRKTGLLKKILGAAEADLAAAEQNEEPLTEGEPTGVTEDTGADTSAAPDTAEPNAHSDQSDATLSGQTDAPNPNPDTDIDIDTDTDTPSAQADAAANPAQPQRPLYPVIKAESTTHLVFYAPPVPVSTASDSAEKNEQQSSAGATSSRRRTRRRGGENTPQRQDSHSESRQSSSSDEPQPVRGSTRVEAKRQRRRDIRESTRRRQVVTEVEFLARREGVDRSMVVRAVDGVTEIAVLEDNILVEHYVTRSQNASLIGNVYLGKVQNVLPSMEAAFVDIGRGRNAVLYAGEVDWDNAETISGNQPRRIELALKSGDPVLVQVTKDPVGHKGARLTSQISLPGRYLVYVPNGSMNGISRKLPEPERVRLKKILKEILPENSGVIVRTAAEGATQEQLTRDVQNLSKQWEQLSRNMESSNPPSLLHSEPELLVKIIRDVFNEDFQKLIISGDSAAKVIRDYLGAVAPDLLERVEDYKSKEDIFQHYRVVEQVAKALDRKVWLPSGGSLIIDRTEAMTVIDVNTGKFIGSGGNLEETVTKNNLEAVEEIVRQLRLRDIGGIIVIDFIDMVLEGNRDLVLRRLVECLSRDRTKHQVAEVTSLGLVQMTRKKIGLGLSESFAEVSSQKDQGEQQPRRNDNRRNRQSGGNSVNEQKAAPQNPTHSLNDDIKNAVAQIVASTITSPEAEDEAKSAVSAQDSADTETVTVLDIPVPRRRKKQTVASQEVPDVLQSVLESLPDGRPEAHVKKSRRATRGEDGVLRSNTQQG